MFVKGHQRPAAIYSELKLAQLLPFLLCSDSFLWTLEGRTLLAQLPPPPPLPLLPTPSLPEVCSLFIVQDTTAIQLLGSPPHPGPMVINIITDILGSRRAILWQHAS